MKIQWLDDAIYDLKSIRHYIAQENSNAAARIVKKIVKTTKCLSAHPELGRAGRIFNTRELIISGTPYLLPYRVKNKAVEILRVFHCAIMKWPED